MVCCARVDSRPKADKLNCKLVHDKITIAGREFVDILVDQAHVDGNLVSAPAWPRHPDWLSKFSKVLGTKIELWV